MSEAKGRRKGGIVRAIFLSPFLARAAWAIAIAVLLRLVIVGVNLNAVQPQWQALKAAHEAWEAAGKGPACVQLFSQARSELYAFPKCDSLETIQSITPTLCESRNEQLYHDLVTRLKTSGCPHDNGNPYDSIIERMLAENQLPRAGSRHSRYAEQQPFPYYMPPYDPGSL